MGRHVDAAGSTVDLRRTAQVAGLVGGICWVVTLFFAETSAVATTLLWVGAVLLTVALFGLGLLLVKSEVLLLRIFVALALPTLVWAVFALVRGAVAHPQLVDAIFGAGVGVISALQLTRPHSDTRRGATL